MKKLLALIIFAFTLFGASADIKVLQDQLKLESQIVKNIDANKLMTQGNNNLAYHQDWPVSPSGTDYKQAMLIIKWIGLPPEGVKNVKVSLDSGSPYKVQSNAQGDVQTWIFMPLSTKSVTLSHPSFGTARVFLRENMNQHDVWTVPVILDRLVNIQIKPATDYDKSVKVTLINPESGEERTKMTPATFDQVMPGNYNLRFAVGGRNRDEKILVTPTKTVFGAEDFDFRNFKDVTIESTDKAQIFVDGAYQGEGTKISARLPYGSHTLTAKVNENRKDEKTVDISADSESIIYLSPTETKTFEVIGLYNGKPVSTSIYVDGIPSDRYSSASAMSHSFTLPALGGKPYRFNVYYDGHRASKDISIRPDMQTRQEIKISGDRKMIWPWQRDYDPAAFGWEFSYVAKQYSTSGNLYEDSSVKTTIKENGVWDDGYDHWLHGFRTGFHAQPTLKIGLGFYTGFFMEFYFSGNDEGIGYYDKYFEMDLSIPLHALYQFPLGRSLAIGFHTGPTLNYAAVGSYYDKFLPTENDYDNVEDWTDFWDESWAPSRFNVTWDFGLYIRWKWLMISGTLSQGMTNNKMHTDFGSDCRTVMNKRILAFSIAF
ncbi:MAG: hypothetical protein NC328_04615 [Muribaculum sp.]|nr:hypothetical protein [Muribaculum sp.]